MGNFNTVGILQNTPAPSASKAQDANAQVKPTVAEIDSLDALQMLLDVVGLIPGAGAPADLINGLISAARGDLIGAGLSLFGVVPIAGEAATVAKIAAKSEKYLQALEVVAKKVMPHLPAGLQRKLQDAIDAAKKKIEEIAGKNKPAPAPAPSPPPAAGGGKGNGGKVKPKPKPKCGQSGPYKDRKVHDNAGMNWDHIPSQAALLKAARRVMGRRLEPYEIKAIIDNAPTIAVPEQLHRDHSETYGGRQNQKIDGQRRIEHDSRNLSKAAKSNTDKMLGEIDKYDPGCKGAYRDAAEKITNLSDDQWDKWLKQTVTAAAGK